MYVPVGITFERDDATDLFSGSSSAISSANLQFSI